MSSRTYTLKELADRLEAQLIGDPDYSIEGVESLESASPSDASYLTEHPFGGSIRGYETAMNESRAGVIVIGKGRQMPEGRQFLMVENPSQAFQRLVELFHVPIASGFKGIHPTAVIHRDVQLGEGVDVGPFAVIDQGAVIGENTRIDAHVFVGAKVNIGAECHLYPHVTVREGCRLGNRVILQPGVVLGSCGFGYTTGPGGKHVKLRQLGTVVLEDDVEIGANTTIDRARFGMTTVKRGTKIDNLVMIGHGVQIGEDNLIVAQTGIAGSAKTGRYVVLGGQVGVAGHLEICDKAVIAARSGVIGSLTEPGQYYGEPARPKAEARRYWMRLLSLERLFEKVKELEQQVKTLLTPKE